MKTQGNNDLYLQYIQRLRKLAYNLWWSWNPSAQAIFKELSPITWELTHHNPVAVLSQISEKELCVRLSDNEFLHRVQRVLQSFESYMKQRPRELAQKLGKRKLGTIAYFCAEFGIHESLPFYSGGLGVLAGDYTKSASDIGLPFIGVGLFYRQGYFKQRVDGSGVQVESYPHTDPMYIPVELVRNELGQVVKSYVEIGSRRVYFQAWRMNVGHSTIYLLDDDVPENEKDIRGFTALAYGGDITTRLNQEIILGIGGVRLLSTLGIQPAVFHINEGHAAFLTLELLRQELEAGKTLAEAEKVVKQSCIFTTHTPVPAGHDVFPKGLIEVTLHSYFENLRLPASDIIAYGQVPGSSDLNSFSMTILAMRFSRSVNGVSARHGSVSREMWKHVYNVGESKRVPIGHITNGVHIPSWTTKTCWDFWESRNSHHWKTDLLNPRYWEHITDPKVLSDEELWALRYALRRELIEFIRQKACEMRVHGYHLDSNTIRNLLSPDILTIGFARRFATYKRAPLIFSDIHRAEKIFNNPIRPVQMIFAGKAHPRDNEGKEFLRRIIEVSHSPQFVGKVIFIEDYDMDIARHLISGCDLWLNTPRIPFEACGTSGQKIIINGGLHISTLDGWWNEAFNGNNGWAIGQKTSNLPQEEQDRRDAQSLYKILTEEVIPMFYTRDKNGIPRQWIKRIRASMRTIIPQYNTHRMLFEYSKKYYYPKDR